MANSETDHEIGVARGVRRSAPALLGLHAAPPKWLRVSLALVPFLLLIAAYFVAAQLRHAENPDDKVLPTYAQMTSAIDRMAFTEDARTGQYLLWSDTLA